METVLKIKEKERGKACLEAAKEKEMQEHGRESKYFKWRDYDL